MMPAVHRWIPLGAAAALLSCGPDSADLPLELGAIAPQHASAAWSAWSEPVPVSEINTPANEQRAALSKDGLSLYFHSNRAGGFGANDIWVSQRACIECPWDEPVNLGPTINTVAFNEAGPTLSRDAHWLFFNSNRTGGAGGGDIWTSYRPNVDDDFGWGAPVNLGPGVNTSAGESQASYFENAGGAPQLFFVRGSIHVSEMQPDGTWGEAVAVAELANFDGPSIHPNGLEIYVFEVFKDHRIWRATRESLNAPWSAPVELGQLTAGIASVFQPFIHVHGRTETLFIGGVAALPGNLDIYVSTRTRGAATP
jgi:hypothetical protein